MNAPDRKVPVLTEVDRFIARPHKLWIDGAWVEPGGDRRLPVFDPSTGARIGDIADATADDVNRAVAVARKAFEQTWGRMRPADREKCLIRFSEAIERHGEELAQLETINQGKSINLSRAIEVGASVEFVRYMAGWATKIEGTTLELSIPLPPGAKNMGFTLREPVGVVAAIVPWNFPLMIALWKVAPALACGCTVVLKPSQDTPLTALRLGELAKEAGIPDGVLNVITGGGSRAGHYLSSHAGVDKVTFTGSTAVGKDIGRAALENMTRFSLELGGKNPMIVLSDMDVGAIVPDLMAGCLLNQGQVCAAASRMYIHRDIFDKVVANVEGAMKAMTIGPGMDPTAALQPLVSAKHRDSVAQAVDVAVAEGVKVVTGGRKPDMAGFYYEPTLLVNAAEDSVAVKQEIFGPVITANPVDNLDEAIARANATNYGLAASVWSNDINAVLRTVRRLKAGTIWVNSHIPVDPNLPFGGFKQSGYGREHGRAAIEQYTETKSVCIPVMD
jgi:phenylacetaldehyde dehydrogenase